MRLQRSDVPRIYALTSAVGGWSLTEIVRRLAAAGLEWIQVREKGRDDLALWRDLALLDRGMLGTARLFINDRVDLALTCGAAGVHLGDRDLPANAARRIAPDLVIGVSTHDREAAVAAAADPAVDYVAVGPIFSSPTKNVRPPLGLEILEQIRPFIDKPVVAIGGIDAANIRDVLAAGADTAAVISSLYLDEAIERNVERLLKATGSP